MHSLLYLLYIAWLILQKAPPCDKSIMMEVCMCLLIHVEQDQRHVVEDISCFYFHVNHHLVRMQTFFQCHATLATVYLIFLKDNPSIDNELVKKKINVYASLLLLSKPGAFIIHSTTEC